MDSPSRFLTIGLYFHLSLLQEATLGLQQLARLDGLEKEIEKMLYYATPTGSEGSSETGYK